MVKRTNFKVGIFEFFDAATQQLIIILFISKVFEFVIDHHLLPQRLRVLFLFT